MTEVLNYGPLLLSGVWITVTVSLGSLLLVLVLGVLGATAKVYGSRTARGVANVYTTMIRSIPDLCLMLLIYFGGQELVNWIGDQTGWWRYLEVNQFAAAVFTIGFIYGAYLTETFRGALLAVPKGQYEAARALSLPARLAFQKVVFPQLVFHALPGLSNIWLVLLKTTALVSLIGLQDVVWQAFAAGRTTRQLFTFFAVTMVVYLIITLFSDLVLKQVERRVSVGIRRAQL